MWDKCIQFVKQNKTFFIVSTALLSYYLVWWLAFYPGTMSPDSISHWLEAESFHFTNASPYLYSLIMSGLRLVWDSPSVMGLLQILFLVIVVATTLNHLYKRGIKLVYIASVVVLFVILPQFGIYNVTIWKDVLYSYVALGFMLGFYFLIVEKQENDKLLIITAVLMAFIPLLRFNGVIFFALAPLLLLITNTLTLKKTLIFTSIAAGVYIFFAMILLNLLSVTQMPLMKEGIYVKVVGAIYHMENPNLTSEQRKIFSNIMPESDWKKYYTCVSVDYLYYKGLVEGKRVSMTDEIDKNPEVVKAWHGAVISAAIKNPGAVLYDKACLGSYILGIKSTLYKYEIYLYSPDANAPIVVEDSKLPIVRKEFIQYLRLTSANSSEGADMRKTQTEQFINYVLWSAMIPISIFVAFGLMSLKMKHWATFCYTLLMGANIIFVIMIVPAASFRYIFAIYPTVIFLPLLYNYEKK